MARCTDEAVVVQHLAQSRTPFEVDESKYGRNGSAQHAMLTLSARLAWFGLSNTVWLETEVEYYNKPSAQIYMLVRIVGLSSWLSKLNILVQLMYQRRILLLQINQEKSLAMQR
jgi:hypothetical protein